MQSWIDSGQTPSIAWQLFAYAILTASEVMVSITCLEFAYTQAPKSMKSLVMAVFLFSVSLGNLFTSVVNKVILVDSGDAKSIEAVTNQKLQAADALIRSHFSSNEARLPETSVGQAHLNGIVDKQDLLIQYRLINRNLYKLTSFGPDKTFMTPDDVILKVSISRPKISGDQTDSPLTWRENCLIELLGDDGKAMVQRERGGVPTLEFDTQSEVGGQSKLEGAAYFWFWTWTMLATAILFVFVAVWYKPKTYLQEEVVVDL